MENFVEVDVRGLSCPEPVLLTMDAMQDNPGRAVRVLGDEAHTRRNIEKMLDYEKRALQRPFARTAASRSRFRREADEKSVPGAHVPYHGCGDGDGGVLPGQRHPRQADSCAAAAVGRLRHRVAHGGGGIRAVSRRACALRYSKMIIKGGFPMRGASFCAFSVKRVRHERCRKISRTIPVSPPE